MYNNPYLNNINFNDRIDNEIERLKQMKTQVQQPMPITQNFQLAPTHNGIRYANTIDDVKKEIVYFDTPFFSRDMSVLWLKNVKGDIKPYELKEIVQKDEKDLKIDYLMAKINELEKGIIKDESTNDADEPTTDTSEGKESTIVPTVSKPGKKSK